VAWLRALVVFPFGLAVGSFLTVVIHRMPEKRSVIRPRSRCPGCGTELANKDNIPVVSWLLLRGRCRTCGMRISSVYPLTELATGALFAAAGWHFADPWVVVEMCVFLALMPAVIVIDVRHRIIPNALTYPALIGFPAFVVVAWAFGAPLDPIRAGIGFLAYGGGVLVVALVSGGMGMGDVKLAGVIGVVLGGLGLRFVGVAAALAIVLGGLGAVVALTRGAGRKSAIPFGPYLAAGAMIATFVGGPIASAYLRTLT
jgi:leader peptidase (prepilin peptidase) / N-methyltransferase